MRKKEAAWLLSFLSSDEELLTRVHFVDQVRFLEKSIIISTRCSNMPSFQFTKHKRLGTDVETVFYDIKTFPHEDLYIGLYFKDRAVCPEFAAVLEVNPMEKQDLVQDKLLGLFAEMLLDQSVVEFRKKELYRKIDESLANQDKEAFLQLSEQWREILELENKSSI